jgi:arylsulfatase A-like enzyme
MARPRIGIFGALVAVGGLLAWRWAQKHRASQAHLNRDLSRWEDEGGAVVSVAQTAPAAAGPAGAASATGTNGASHGLFRTAER